MLRKLLTLSDQHRADLHRRGFTDEEIEERGYASTPTLEQGIEIARRLSVDFDLRGVPGFYRSGSRARMVGCRAGYFIPYLNERGQIQAMQYRLDASQYIWFSSSPEKYADGSSSGAPLHFSGRKFISDSKEIWLTEGGLKADCASYLLNVPFIAAAGVGNFGADFGDHFRKLFPDKTAIVAFDSDFQTNVNVRAALGRLVDQLVLAEVPYTIRTWQGAKGIDDYARSLSHTKRRAA